MALPASGPISFSASRAEMSQSLVNNYAMSSWTIGDYNSSAIIYAPINIFSSPGTFTNTSATRANVSMSNWYNYNHTTASNQGTTASLFMTTGTDNCYPSSMVIFNAGTSNVTLSINISGSNDSLYDNSIAVYYGKPWQDSGLSTGSATMITGSGVALFRNNTLSGSVNLSFKYNYTYDAAKGQYLYIVSYYNNCNAGGGGL